MKKKLKKLDRILDNVVHSKVDNMKKVSVLFSSSPFPRPFPREKSVCPLFPLFPFPRPSTGQSAVAS